ncbi:MAG: hypothetical protein WCX74_04040 [Candidatus Paceibacterota bacterium]
MKIVVFVLITAGWYTIWKAFVDFFGYKGTVLIYQFEPATMVLTAVYCALTVVIIYHLKIGTK